MFCPKCKTDNAHRSHRHGLVDFILSLGAVYPYRCHDCKHRFHRFRYAKEIVAGGRSSGRSATEREIRATRASIRWKQRRREVLLYALAALLLAVFLYYISREPKVTSEGNGTIRAPAGGLAAPNPRLPLHGGLVGWSTKSRSRRWVSAG